MLLFKQFTTGDSLPTVNLDRTFGEVQLRKGEPGHISVRVTGEGKYRHEVSASFESGVLSVRGPSDYSNLSISFGKNQRGITISGSCSDLSIVNGKVFVGGKEIKPDDSGPGKNEEPLVFEITLPEESNLVIGKTGKLESEIDLGDVELDVSGQSRIKLKGCKSLIGSIKGQSTVESRHRGGPLNCKVKGQSKLTVTGAFSDADIEAKGMSDITTIGPVEGDFKVAASGMSHVRHYGTISGQIDRQSKGMSEIDIE